MNVYKHYILLLITTAFTGVEGAGLVPWAGGPMVLLLGSA